jgi:hypothetical protein
MKKLMLVVIIVLLSLLGYLFFGYTNNQEVVTVEMLNGEKVDVINTLNLSVGDSVILEEQYLEKWRNNVIPTPVTHDGTCIPIVINCSNITDRSSTYEMKMKKEAQEIKPLKIKWVIQDLNDSLIKTGLYEVSYPTLIQIISIKKGVVKEVVKKRRIKS